ncbi:MAG: dual specificity protein phosphatase 23 [Candidatus Sumerlaeota bacterium]|nr:dual specificity protein phosphatase 23 [Candidatus Sumerlaeota bacterium]
MVANFSYIVGGQLAGSARPGRRESLRENLMWLYEQGIRAVVTLTHEPIAEAMLRETGLRSAHVPVDDFAAPSLAQIREAVAFIHARLQANEPVVVHCESGYGRTGVVLACYLASTGMSARAAIEDVRRKRSGSIETSEQEEAVEAYAKSLKRKKS